MNNENESEKMARAVLDAERYHRKALCLNRVGKSRLDCICESLYAAGIGDKKQAVKEFAEKLKEMLCEYSDTESWLDEETGDGLMSVCQFRDWVLKDGGKIDDLITELYGDDKNEN